jgi:hypothetical protein
MTGDAKKRVPKIISRLRGLAFSGCALTIDAKISEGDPREY